tara:strand:+ start:782 stop:5140 length:4359 start_codon:yes stop_codon:yes gene_type:complete
MSAGTLTLDLSKIRNQSKVNYKQAIDLKAVKSETIKLESTQKQELKINLEELLDSIKNSVSDKGLTLTNDKKAIELNYNGQNLKVDIKELNATVNAKRGFITRMSESSTSTERIISKLAKGESTTVDGKVFVSKKRTFFNLFSSSKTNVEIGKLNQAESISKITDLPKVDTTKLKAQIQSVQEKINNNPKLLATEQNKIKEFTNEIKKELEQNPNIDQSTKNKFETLEKSIETTQEFLETGVLNTDKLNKSSDDIQTKLKDYKSTIEFISSKSPQFISTDKNENTSNIVKTLTLFEQKILNKNEKTETFLKVIHPKFKELLNETSYSKTIEYLPSMETKSTQWMAVYDTALKIHLQQSENPAQSMLKSSIHLLETQHKDPEDNGPIKKTLLKLYALEATDHQFSTSNINTAQSTEEILETSLISLNQSLPEPDNNINLVLIGATTKKDETNVGKITIKTKKSIQKYKQFILDGIQKTLDIKESASTTFAKNFQYLIGSSASKDQLSASNALKTRDEVLNNLIGTSPTNSPQSSSFQPTSLNASIFQSLKTTSSIKMSSGYDKEKTTLNTIIDTMKSNKADSNKLKFAEQSFEKYLFNEQSTTGTDRVDKLRHQISKIQSQNNQAGEILKNILDSVITKHKDVSFNLNKLRESAQNSTDYSTSSKIDLSTSKATLKNELHLSSLSDANVQDISKLTRNTNLLSDMLKIYQEPNIGQKNILKEEFGKKYSKAGTEKGYGQKIASSISNTVNDTNRELKFYHFEAQFKNILEQINTTPPPTTEAFIKDFHDFLLSPNRTKMDDIDQSLKSRQNLIDTAQRDIKSGEGQYSIRDGISQTMGFEKVNLTHNQISSIKVARTLILGLTAENKKTETPSDVFHHISSHLELSEQAINQLPSSKMSATEKNIYLFLKKDENKAILNYFRSATAELSQINDSKEMTTIFNSWTEVQTANQEIEKLEEVASQAQEQSVSGTTTELSQINQDSFKKFFEMTKNNKTITLDFTKSRFFNTQSASSAARIFTSNALTDVKVNVGQTKKNQILINYDKKTNQYLLTLKNVKEQAFTTMVGGDFWKAGISISSDKEKNITYNLSEKDMLSIGSKLLSGTDVSTESLTGTTGKGSGQKFGLYASADLEIPKIMSDSMYEISELSTKIESIKSNITDFISETKQTLSESIKTQINTDLNHLKSELSQTNNYIQEQIESTNLQDPLQVAELEKNITTAKNTISEKIEHFLSSINNPELTEKLNSITASITPPITTEAIQEKIASTEDKGSYSLSSGIELEVARKTMLLTSSLTKTNITTGSGKFSLTVLGQKIPAQYEVKYETVTNTKDALISKSSEETYIYNKYSPLDTEVHQKLENFQNLPLYSLPITVKRGLSEANQTKLLSLKEEDKESFIIKHQEIIEISTSSTEKTEQAETSIYRQIEAQVGYIQTDKQSINVEQKLILYQKNV